jgi:iron complex outermembrane receptor protein
VNKWLKAGGNFTFSQNKIADFTEYVNDYDNGTQRKVDHGTTDIAFSPNETGSATITLIPVSKAPHGQHVEIDIMDKYVGKQYLDNTSNNDRVLKAYNFCNVLLRYTVQFRPFKELIATVGLNNIFSSKYENNGYTYSYYSGNQLYTDNAYFPQAGFHYMAGLSMKW